MVMAGSNVFVSLKFFQLTFFYDTLKEKRMQDMFAFRQNLRTSHLMSIEDLGAVS